MFKVRQANTGDLLAINNIYNHYVINTAITFDEQTWDLTKRHQWFAAFNNAPYQLLVA
ncbi:MAG: N-acetyltransferase, partial [Gammaproteobacteria bacterium]|nr:N-acetyltransferase [Gammaproteobacteria bacterium]